MHLISYVNFPIQVNSKNIMKNKSRRLTHGFSIIELMVGIAIGMFVLAGASSVFVNNVVNSRKILFEARINQNLRSAMDLIVRDLRRSAYWGNAMAGTVTVGSSSVTQTNPYSNVDLTGTNQIRYSYTRDLIENNQLDLTFERFGIRHDETTRAVQLFINGSWNSITDNSILSVTSTGFTITPTETEIDLRKACSKICIDTVLPPLVPTATQNCPRTKVRTYKISLTGNSVSDVAVSRTHTSQVRVRNDALLGACTN